MTTALSLAPADFRPDADVLPRCLLLAVLLHIWLALMVGNRPGLETPGRGVWGSLQVTLTGPSGQAAPSAEGDVAQPAWRDDGPLGEAASSRHGGRLRQQAPPLDSGPGAQTLGRWKAQELPPEPSRAEEETAGSSGQGALEQAAQLPATQVPAAPTLPRDAAPNARARRLPTVDALTPSAAPLRELSARIEPLPAAVEAPPAPSLRSLPTEPGRRPQAAREALSAPRSSLRADGLTPVPAAPVLMPDPTPEPTLRTLAAEPLQRPERPREIQRAPRTQALPEALPPLPAAPPAPEPEPTLRTLATEPARRPPVQRQALPTPRAPALPESLSPLQPAPALPRELPSAAATVESGQAAPAQAPSPQPRPATNDAQTSPQAQPLTRGDPLADPVPGQRASPGSPEAGARVGHDVATPPSASASAPLPPLNLNLPRSGAAASVRRGPGLLEVLPGVPDPRSKLEKSIEDAKREDCRKAHADKGLLGAGALLVDSVRGKGCKW